MKLYEIRNEIEELLRQVDPETGEIPEEAFAQLRDLDVKLEHKALDVAAYIVNLTAEASALKEQAAKLSDRARICTNRADSLRRYLAENLSPGQKLKDSRVTIGWRKSQAVEIDLTTEELKALYPDYVVTMIRPDKALIKRKLLEGERLPGVVLAERHNLQVK